MFSCIVVKFTWDEMASDPLFAVNLYDSWQAEDYVKIHVRLVDQRTQRVANYIYGPSYYIHNAVRHEQRRPTFLSSGRVN